MDCKGYSADRICECFPQFEKLDALRNMCTKHKADNKLANCILSEGGGTTDTGEAIAENCLLCREGYFLEDGQCVCNLITNAVSGQCNDDRCWEMHKGCKHCTREECLVCDDKYDLCKLSNTTIGPKIANCKYHKIPTGCHRCNEGFILDAAESMCIVLADPAGEQNP